MQASFKDGFVMVSGTCGRDAELKRVGQKDSRMCSVSVAVGKRVVEGSDKPDTIWCNLKAWHTLAEVLARAQKGDSLFAVGRLESREHEGKTYTDLVAEFVSVASVSPAFGQAVAGVSSTADAFTALYTDDGELPF